MSLTIERATLPLPGVHALAHSRRLAEHIAERMAAAGAWLSFAEYMQLALYAPGLGYYSAGASKFGAAGDFVTAPMISPLFARCCAHRFIDWLVRQEAQEVLEFGPGTGQFAAEALGVLSSGDSPLQHYRLLEVSADLRERQQRLLASTAAGKVKLDWLDSLPKDFAGVVFANEILDALPCERFVVRGGELWRLGVGLAPGGLSAARFEWRMRPADGACADDDDFRMTAARLFKEKDAKGKVAIGDRLPEGYCGEWQPSLAAWFAALAVAMTRGAVLIADYGLPRGQLLHPQRMAGSLRCHYRHQAHGDPFIYPGLCDITAWVDFTAVAEAATQAGFQISGFTTQAGFLLGAGIDQQLALATAGLDPTDPRHIALARGARTLLLPGEMGEAVKFMLLTREVAVADQAVGMAPSEVPGAPAAPVLDPAFSLQDLRSSLWAPQC